MADYLVTDTELTSLANAIRTKTGDNSSLTFPSGFVSAIEGITTSSNNTWDGFGENPVLISTLLNDEILFKNTDFATWTPSTTASIILPLENITTMSLAMGQYDYMSICNIIIKVAYIDNTTVANAPLEYYYTCIMNYAKRASTLTMFQNGQRNNSSYEYQEGGFTIYIDANGNTAYTNSRAGFYCSGASPGTSGANSDNTNYTFRTPVLRAICSNDYMTTTMAAAIDQDKSVIKRKMDLYRYTKDSTKQSAIYQNYINMYAAEHSNS